MRNLLESIKELKNKRWAKILFILLIICIIIELADALDLSKKLNLQKRITPYSMKILMIKESEIAVVGEVKKSGLTKFTQGTATWGFRSFTLKAEKYLKGTGPEEIHISLASSNAPGAPQEGTRLVAFLYQEQEGKFQLYQYHGCTSGFISIDDKEEETIKYVERVMQGKTVLSFIGNYIDLPVFYACL